MTRTGLLIGCLAAALDLTAQTAPATYWVQFTDKAHTPFSIATPSAFLSDRAIARRQRQGIAIDSLDLPVDPIYINALLAAGQIQLHSVSKWFNAVTIISTDTLALDTLAHLPFVHQLRCTRPAKPHVGNTVNKFPLAEKAMTTGSYDAIYGGSLRQIAMMNGHLLHSLGHARGEGMLIGILDAGFDNADSLDAFAELRPRDGILFTHDFVQPGADVFNAHWHGRSVLSIIAGHVEGQLLGTAPQADFVLLRTENADTEYPVEEDNWISGAEVADSIGCDVLNTSLGYTEFDDSTMNNTYAELDGNTIRASIAEGIASRKGMIPVNSAGNSGAAAWHYLSSPADAIDILTVGAVKDDRSVANFSSRGPSADGRVKPDVSAMGQSTIGLGIDGQHVEPISGTSFSSPLVCGLTACLWQLHPDKSAHAIMDAVRRSASCSAQPNDSIGYGIPDFWRAHRLLGGNDLTQLVAPEFFNIYPVPFSDHLDIELFTGEATHVDMDLFDIVGRPVLHLSMGVEPLIYQQLRIEATELAQLPEGAYVLAASIGGRAEITRKVMRAE